MPQFVRGPLAPAYVISIVHQWQYHTTRFFKQALGPLGPWVLHKILRYSKHPTTLTAELGGLWLLRATLWTLSIISRSPPMALLAWGSWVS
jgi:hypothetical protein